MGTPDKPATELRLVRSEPIPQAAREASVEPTDLNAAYRRYAPYVAAIAGRILGSDSELDDAVQDVFLDAARGIDGLREPGALKGWLARITVRICVRRLRLRRLRRVLPLPREPLDYEAVVSPEASPEQRALVIRVYRALDGLPAQERAAWVLRHMQGESLEDAAVLCGCSLSTLQRRLRRAEALLDQELGHD